MISQIKQFEGLSQTAVAPRWGEKHYTIGYGHYDESVQPGQKITEEQADRLLRKDLSVIEKSISKKLPNLLQKQFDAICSLCYNVGLTRFLKSGTYHYIDALHKASPIGCALRFGAWCLSGGKFLRGLLNRRCIEANWFLGEQYFKVSGRKLVPDPDGVEPNVPG